MSVLAECLHPPLEAYGRRAKAIVDQTRDIDGIPSTVLEDVLNASIVAVVEYLTSQKAGEQYEKELLNHPAHRQEALASWIRQLLVSLGIGAANDLCHAAINNLCSQMSGKGSIAKGLAWFAQSTTSKAVVVGMVILLAITMVTAYMDTPVGGRTSYLAGAMCSVALDAACLLIGTSVAAIGGIVPVLAAIAFAWGLSYGVRYVWAQVDVPRQFTVSQVWQAVKIAVGWTPRALQAPCWDIQPQQSIDIGIQAPDMCCPITHAVFVEPCSLHGHFFERSELEAWVKMHHTNPMTREHAYLNDIKASQPMRNLVVEFAQAHNLRLE
ncbi:MAG: hypothetical protein FRX49_01485 [Trebouxia sp. A1-2]|nr:MAG: hypothetical protein FRX49_01485 [Trebouxia sp. A1-2]